MKKSFTLYLCVVVLVTLASKSFAQKQDIVSTGQLEVAPSMLPDKAGNFLNVHTQTMIPQYDAPAVSSFGIDEAESNNSSATATPITGVPAKIKANIYPNGDIDWYSFTAAAGSKVYAAVMTSFSSGSSTDCQLTLYASDGTTVIEFDDDNGSFASLSSSIAGASIPSSGTYYIKVNDFTAGTASERGYNLYLQVQSGSPTAEVESNDTPATANSMPASGWVSGARNPAAATEQDWYSVTLAAGESVFISMDLDPERDGTVWNGRLGFGLFGDASNQILVVDDAGSTETPSTIPSEAFFFTAKDAGTYYVFVDAASAATGGATATYNVSFCKFDALTGYTNFASSDIPKVIGPGTGSVTSTLTVPGSPRIEDLSVRVALNHALMADIDATLTSPGGNTIHLFSDIGSSATGGQTQMDLFFNDNNAITPAFTVLRPMGYLPENNGKLNQFKNMNAGGTWTLTLYDDGSNASGGNLTAWSLDILEDLTPDISTATVVFSTDFESGAAGFTHSGTADEWALGTPATPATSTSNPIAGFTTANSGVNCWKTDLTGTYNINSDQILTSPSIALPSGSSPLWLSWAMRYQMENASFDHLNVVVQQVGNPASAVTLFEWLGATQTAGVGNPTVNVPQSAGWATHYADVSAFAGQNIELLVRLTSDNTVVLGGVAIDDVNVYQLCTPPSITLGTSPVICAGAVTANLPYTVATGAPDRYSIDFDAAAEAAGFTDVVNAVLPSSPIILTVPGSATATAYNGNISVATASDGCFSIPVAFTVTLNQIPTVDAVTDQEVCAANNTADIIFTGSVAGTVYNWTNSAASIGLAASGSGNISSFTAVNATSDPIVATITVTPSSTNSGVTCTGTPVSFTITVNPTPNVNSVSNQAVCNGSATAAIPFTGTVAGTTFSWTNDNPSIGLAASGTGDIASFTAVNTGSSPLTATITVTPSMGSAGIVPELLYYKFNGSSTTVPNLASAPPSGTNNAIIEGVQTQGGSAICDGTLIGSGGASNTDRVNTGWATNLNGTSWTISFKTSNIQPSATLYYIFGDPTATSFRCFTNGVAGANNWILRGPINDITISGGATVAEHTNTFVYDNVAGATKAYLDGVLQSAIPQGVPTIGGSGPFTVGAYSTNTGLNTGGFMDEFCVFNRALSDAEVLSLATCNSGLACPGTPITFTITANPTPTVDAIAPQSLCSGTPTSAVTFSGAVSGTVYNWTNDNTSIGLAASGSGNISSFTAVNTGLSPVTATITVTPSYTNAGVTCTGIPQSFTITVQPAPSVNPVSNQVVCNGSATSAVAFTSPVSGTVYDWTNNTPSIGLAASGTGDIASFNAVNTGTAPLTATITVTPSSTTSSGSQSFGYTGSMQTWTVPAGVTSISLEAYGAQGGTGASGGNAASGGVGGMGSKVTGSYNVTPGQVLNIYVGGEGMTPDGGYNGGAAGGSVNAGGGGGATDVRINGTSVSDRILVAAGGGGGGRSGCEQSVAYGGAGGTGDGNGFDGADAPTSGGFAGGGKGGNGVTGGVQGIGCAGFLGGPGVSSLNDIGGVGGGGQSCCCFNFSSIPGGGGGGGGFFGGGGGGGGSAGTTGCSGNDKGGGGGGAGGSSYATALVGGVVTPGVRTGEGMLTISYMASTCPGTPIQFTITANPTPTVNSVSNQIVCNATSTTAVAFSGAVSGTVYNWTNNNTSIGLAASGSGNISSFTAVNTGAAPVVATITVTPSFTNAGVTCSGSPVTFTITVNPSPTPAISVTETSGISNNDGIICTGASVTLTASGGISYLWNTGATTAAITVAPSSTTVYSVVVTNSSSCSASANRTITVNPLPTPAITAAENSGIASNDGIICNGASVTLTATGGTSYLWNTGATTAAITVAPSATSTYSVVVTNANNCSASTNYTVTVNPLPVITISGPDHACVNSTGNIYTTQAGMTNYTWIVTGGTITSGSGTNSITVTWTTVGSQSVSVNYSNANGCLAAGPAVNTVTVNPRPVVALNGPAEACSGRSYSYTSDAGMSNYVWSVSAGGTITSGGGTNTVVVLWNTPGAKTISVNYDNAYGCPALSPTVLNVSVSLSPVPTITGPDEVCAATENVVYTTESGFTGYTWSVSNGGIITGGNSTNTVTVNWTAAGNKFIAVDYSNADGCNALTPTIKYVTVNSLPAPLIFGEDTVCSGTQNVAYTTQANYSNYVWTVSSGGTIASGQGTNDIVVNWNGSGNQTVSVNYTNAFGCEALEPWVLNVFVKSKPAAATAITGPNHLCTPAVGIVFSVPAIANAESYVWTLPSGTTVTAGANTSSITVDFAANAVSGIIKVFGFNTCGNGIASPDFNLQVNPTPATPVITRHGDTLVSSAVAGNQWYLDGVLIPGATDQKYVATQNGNYYVISTINGCSSAQSNVIEIVDVAVKLVLQEKLLVYPNPNHGEFTIEVITAASEDVNIQIYNSIGALIWKQDNVIISGNYTTKVDIHQLPDGVYMVALKNDHINLVKRVVIVK